MLGEDLDHDAGGAPDVDCGTVLGFAEEEFRGTIPYRDDTVGVVELAALGVEAGEAEVGEFELAGVADEDVGGFDVAVEDSPAMEIVETFEELFSEVFLVGVRELEGRVVEEAGQVVGKVFEDHEAVVLFDHDFLETDDVFVLEGLQELDFADGGYGEAVFFAFHADFFEGNEAFGIDVNGFEYFAIGA